MWNYVGWALENFRELPRFSNASTEAIFQEMFPGLRVVHVVRRDRLRQAISWLRAAEDGVWVVSDEEPARPIREPVYQYDVIVGMMDLIAQGEKSWLDLYEKLGLIPLTVEYEELTSLDGYDPTVRQVLRHLDLDDTIELPRPRTMRQANSVSDEWAARFRRDHRAS
jgi:LPS sulfotransferase NodH